MPDDFTKFCLERGLTIMNFRDVRRLAIESRNYSNISNTTDLESLAKIVSNVELNKPAISESNWEARTLSHEHIEYA